MGKSTLIAIAVVLVMVFSALGVAIGHAQAARGAVDSYGYRYTDSKSLPPSVFFNWIDIRSNGTVAPVSGDDTSGGPFPIGFNFTFYGNRYTAFNISTNGMITFGSRTSDLSPDSIPDTWTPNNFIAAYWDDLYVNTGEIMYQTIGSAPDRQMVVQYSNVTELSSSQLMTFEIVLCEGKGDVWLQYLTLSGETGSGACIGMENNAGTTGVEYGYYDAVLTDNLAVVIAIAPFFLSSTQTLYEKPGNSVEFAVTLTNNQWFGDSFAIGYESLLLGWTVALYDSGMSPLVDHDGDGLADTGTVATNSTVTFYVNVTIPISPISQVEMTLLNATSFSNNTLTDQFVLRTCVLSAWFDPPHTDEGFDTDGDGLFNYLLINASVYVYATGWYTLWGYVYTASEAYIGYDYNQVYLTAGSNEIGLSYYGWLVHNTGMNSPYHAHLYLYNWTMMQDQGLHTTGSSYQYDDFMLQPGVLETPFSDCGVDTDGDGLFDYLQVNVTLTINYAGRFILSGTIEDSSWTSFDTQTNDSMMTTGSVTVHLRYDAWTIWKNGVEGVFHIGLSLQGEVDGTVLGLGSQWYTTASYMLALFERPPGVFQPPHSERVTDADGDVLYDFLVIEAQVNISVEGDYRVRGIMTDWWDATVDIVENSTHLAVGTQIVELWYPGWPIRYNGEDGPYDIELLLFNSTMLLDDDDYSTAWYDYWDFETAPGWFEPPHSEFGDDMNGDTLFDFLVVRVGVNVTMDGTYVIDARLRDWTWTYIQDQSNTTLLAAGLNIVELRFAGWLIRDNGRDGPYTVLLTLSDVDGRQMDTDSFSTASYSYTEFQTIPAQLGWPHEVAAMDDDGDGLYERILVNVSVDVTTPGTFFVRGVLYDSSWSWTTENGVWADLVSGANIVQLSFQAFMIYGHGWNGTYTAYIYLEDANRYYLDSDSVSIAYYYYDDFDPASPRIYSTWASTTPVIDGSFGTSEWSTASVVDLKVAYPLNDLDGRILVMNDGTNLYICYDVYGDTTMDTWDYSSIAFDTGNDNMLSDVGEDFFLVRGSTVNPALHYSYDGSSSTWTLDCLFDTGLPDHSTLQGAASFGPSTGHASDHRIFEYRIPLALIEAYPGQLVGFLGASPWYAGAYDDSESVDGSWPVNFNVQPEIGQYGEILLAQNAPTPPPTTTASVTGTAGSAGWYISAVSVTMSATGGIGGVDRTEYSVNGGTWQDYTGPFSLAAQGTHTVQYRSIDHASQTETTKTVTVKIDTVDPATASAVSGANVWLNSTDATSGIGSTMYRIDNGSWQVYTGMLTVVGAGNHTVQFYSLDAAGNQEVTKSVIVAGAPGDDGNGGGISTSSLIILIGGIIAAIVVALIIILLVTKRKRGQMPTGVPPQMPGYYTMGPPPPPTQ